MSPRMKRTEEPAKHKPFCSAGQPAPCKGYFDGDVLPCICGLDRSVTQVLLQLYMLDALVGTVMAAPGNRTESARAAS